MTTTNNTDLAKLFTPGTRFKVSGHSLKVENGTFEMGDRFDNNWRCWKRVRRDGSVHTNMIARNIRGEWRAIEVVSRWINEGVSIEILSVGTETVETVEAPKVEAVEAVEAPKTEAAPRKTAFVKWFETFLEEKNLPFAHWTLTANDGTAHIINSDVVIEAIKGAPKHEQAGIKTMIVKIDFRNGDVNDYFRHLAGALINA